jgi:hypothetical protein
VTAAQAGHRAFLAGAVAVPATAALPAPISADPIRDAASALAAAMQARHGGRWRVTIDHENCFVLLMPLLKASTPEGGAL